MMNMNKRKKREENWRYNRNNKKYIWKRKERRRFKRRNKEGLKDRKEE